MSLKNYCKKLYERYIIDAMSGMALGLFGSLIIGVLFTQLAKVHYFAFLSDMANITQEKTVVGAAVGVAIGYKLKAQPLVIFSSCTVGALGYVLGGPLGAYIATLVGVEVASLVAGKTPLDIIVSPFFTILAGGVAAKIFAPTLGELTLILGQLVSQWTTLQPFLAGILIAMVVGLTMTSPISSAGLCASIGITGIASGAALIGCAAQMIGFAVASYSDNGMGGLLAQGVGSSKLQLPNALRHPKILIAPTLTGAILGPVSTCVFKLEVSTSVAAGMGNCGLLGPLSALDKMGYTTNNIFIIIMLLFVAPAIISFLLHQFCKLMGWVKAGDMKLTY